MVKIDEKMKTQKKKVGPSFIMLHIRGLPLVCLLKRNQSKLCCGLWGSEGRNPTLYYKKRGICADRQWNDFLISYSFFTNKFFQLDFARLLFSNVCQ